MMNIHRSLSVNFGATPINKTSINRFNNADKTYHERSAYIVELSPKDINDKKAINKAVERWNNDFFGETIASAFNDLSNKIDYNKKDRFFAITTQEKKFNKLQPQRILGLVEVLEGDEQNTDLLYLQVKPPKKLKKSDVEKYNHVGQALVSEMQKIYDDKSISVFAIETAIPFYEYMGFVQDSYGSNKYHWKKEL